jgi:hypothetical protein
MPCPDRRTGAIRLRRLAFRKERRAYESRRHSASAAATRGYAADARGFSPWRRPHQGARHQPLWPTREADTACQPKRAQVIATLLSAVRHVHRYLHSKPILSRLWCFPAHFPNLLMRVTIYPNSQSFSATVCRRLHAAEFPTTAANPEKPVLQGLQHGRICGASVTAR